MAKVTKQDLFQNNLFGSLKKQAEETNKVLTTLDNTITGLAVDFSELDKSIKSLDSKTIESINKSFATSVKLREQSIKVDKEIVQNKKILSDIRKKELQNQKEEIKNISQLEKNKREELKTDILKERSKVATLSTSAKIEIAKREELKTSAQLERNKREEIRTNNLLKRETERQAAAASKLSKANQLLQNKYVQLTKSTNTAQANFKKLAAEFGVNDKRARKARREFEKLDSRLRRINNAAKDGRRDVGRYGLALNGVGVSARSVIGAFGVVGGVQLFARVIGDAVQTFREFQLENARLAGLLGTNREGIAALTEDAKRLGSTTAKTATEVNKLQQAYARLGFSQKEILDLTEDTINGSVALNAELDETAELTGAVVNTFDDLGTSDAGEVLDVLTLATQKSALNFEKLQTALPIVAGAANTAGVSLTELTALLGKLSDSGIDASSSATALRNIFIESAAQGLSYEEILDKILKSQDKLTAATDQFGKRAAVSGTILAKNIQGVKDLDEALQGAAGTAEKFANQTLDTLDGDIKLLTSAWEGLILSIENGEGILGAAFRGAIQGATTLLQNIRLLSVQTKVAVAGFRNLNNKDFRDFIDNFTTNKGNVISDALFDANLELKELSETFNNFSDSIEQTDFGLEVFSSAESKKLIFLEETRERIFQTLRKEGESIEQAGLFADKYLKLVTETAFAQEELSEQTESVVEGEEKKEKVLTGLIEKQRELIKGIREQIEVSKQIGGIGIEDSIRDLQEELRIANEELDRLLGKEADPEKDFTEERIAALRRLQQTRLDIAVENSELESKTLEEALKNIEILRKAEEEAANFKFDTQRDEAKREIEDAITLAAELARIELEREQELLNIKKKADEDRIEADKKYAETKKGIDERLFKILQGLARKQGEKNLEEIDRQIEGITKRQTQLQSLANNGQKEATDSLAEADKEQAQLRLKREKELARQKKIEAGLAAFKILAAKSEAGDKNALGSTILEIASLDAFIASLPTFYDGVDNTGGGSNLDNKGGFLSVLHPEERVMTAKQNQMVGLSTPNELVADVMMKYRSGELTGNTYLSDNRDVVRVLNKVDNNISTLHKRIPIPSSNYDAQEKYMYDLIKSHNRVEKVKHVSKRVLK